MDYIVYRVSSDLTSLTYYGYALAEDKAGALETFMKGAKRAFNPEIRRGDVEWFQTHNQEREDCVVFEIEDVCVDELEAWMIRNDLRASDVFAVTGPSQWPIINYERANKEQPERVKQWKANKEINNCKTARQALKLGAWQFPQIKALSDTYLRETVVNDLDGLTPQDFSSKYELPITYPDVS